MSEQFEVGDQVRIGANVFQSLYAADQKKLKDRTGKVVHKYTRSGSSRETIVVRWGRRGNRGKEFEDHWTARDLERAP